MFWVFGAGLRSGDAGFSDVIQKSGLAMVNMAHYYYYWRSTLHFVLLAFLLPLIDTAMRRSLSV